MKRLREKAASSESYPYKVSSCLKLSNGGIFWGVNSPKTHPISLFLNPWRRERVGTHAEMRSLVNAVNRFRGDRSVLEGSRIYVVRLKRDGDLGMARPCPICEGLLRHHGVKQATFSDREGNFDRVLYG